MCTNLCANHEGAFYSRLRGRNLEALLGTPCPTLTVVPIGEDVVESNGRQGLVVSMWGVPFGALSERSFAGLGLCWIVEGVCFALVEALKNSVWE